MKSSHLSFHVFSNNSYQCVVNPSVLRELWPFFLAGVHDVRLCNLLHHQYFARSFRRKTSIFVGKSCPKNSAKIWKETAVISLSLALVVSLLFFESFDFIVVNKTYYCNEIITTMIIINNWWECDINKKTTAWIWIWSMDVLQVVVFWSPAKYWCVGSQRSTMWAVFFFWMTNLMYSRELLIQLRRLLTWYFTVRVGVRRRPRRQSRFFSRRQVA